jgi:hypothetical protein
MCIDACDEGTSELELWLEEEHNHGLKAKEHKDAIWFQFVLSLL